MSDYRISVIIPVFGDDPTLQHCLHGLARQTLDRACYEILLVQNGPPAACPIHSHGLALRWQREARPGSYRARNRGIGAACHDVLAFLDADCLPEPAWLEAGLRAIHSGADIVAGRILLTYRDPSRLTAVEVYERFNAFRQERNVAKGFSVTANMFVRRSVFRDVGLFRDDLLSGGDVEWGRRAVAGGARIVYARDAVVAHPARHTLAAITRKARRVTGGTFARHRDSSSVAGALLRTLRSTARPPVGFAVHVLRSPEPDIGTGDRLRAIGVRLLIQGTSILEAIRLAAGGTAEHR